MPFDIGFGSNLDLVNLDLSQDFDFNTTLSTELQDAVNAATAASPTPPDGGVSQAPDPAAVVPVAPDPTVAPDLTAPDLSVPAASDPQAAVSLHVSSLFGADLPVA